MVETVVHRLTSGCTHSLRINRNTMLLLCKPHYIYSERRRCALTLFSFSYSIPLDVETSLHWELVTGASPMASSVPSRPPCWFLLACVSCCLLIPTSCTSSSGTSMAVLLHYSPCSLLCFFLDTPHLTSLDRARSFMQMEQQKQPPSMAKRETPAPWT